METTLSGYYADDTTEEWLDKLKSKQMGERPSTADKIENEKYENEKYENERMENEKSDRDFFFATQTMSFNNTKDDSILKNEGPITPNSQRNTMKAKHDLGENTDLKKMFYTAQNSSNKDGENSEKNDHAENLNVDINSEISKIVAEYAKAAESPLKTKSKLIESEADFSQSDFFDFLKELNDPAVVQEKDEEKIRIEMEKIRKYDAEKEKYCSQKKSEKNNLSNKIISSSQNAKIIEQKSSLEASPVRTSTLRISSNSPVRGRTYVPDSDLVTCRSLTFLFENTWGDKNYMGLSGFEILEGNYCETVDLDSKNLFAEPKDLSEIGCFDDPRVVTNIINNQNDTCEDRLMWLIPYTKGGTHVLKISFDKPLKIAGFRVWNYNKSPEDTLRGVKTVRIAADSRILGYSVFRPGPGTDGVEFGQTVYMGDIMHPSKNRMPGLAVYVSNSSVESTAPLSENSARRNSNSNSNNNVISSGKSVHITNNVLQPYIRYITPPIKQDYEVPQHPSGLLWKFLFYENWFDGYYIGLDAIELFDSEGNLLDVRACGATVTATPHSLQDLVPIAKYELEKGSKSILVSDIRTPEKLFLPFRDKDGNKRKEKNSSWLAPLSRSMTNIEKASTTTRMKQRQICMINEKEKAKKGSAVVEVVPARFDDLQLPMDNVLYVMFPYPVAVSFIRLRHAYTHLTNTSHRL